MSIALSMITSSSHVTGQSWFVIVDRHTQLLFASNALCDVFHLVFRYEDGFSCYLNFSSFHRHLWMPYNSQKKKNQQLFVSMPSHFEASIQRRRKSIQYHKYYMIIDYYYYIMRTVICRLLATSLAQIFSITQHQLGPCVLRPYAIPLSVVGVGDRGGCVWLDWSLLSQVEDFH